MRTNNIHFVTLFYIGQLEKAEEINSHSSTIPHFSLLIPNSQKPRYWDETQISLLKLRDLDEMRGSKTKNATQCTRAYTVALVCCS